MEALLQYTWRHRLFPLSPLTTTKGQSVEVIDTGLHNTNAGPDFFNSKVKIDGQLWVGNVEIHLKASDWYTHHHEHDKTYSNVILHVVCEADTEVQDCTGRQLPQLILPIPDSLRKGYEDLLHADRFPPCYKIVPDLEPLMLHSWVNTLQVERLERKTTELVARMERCKGSWEEACFITLARNFGFGVNTDAFELWAQSFPLSQAAHHRDNIFQIQALFLGQAGLLNKVPSLQEKGEAEYRFLQKKYNLQPIDSSLWRYLRLRPQNFPHERLLQLSSLYCSHQATMSRLIEAEDVKAVRAEFDICTENERKLSTSSIDLLIINTVVPLLFAYGRHRMKETLCERALHLLDQLKPENNNVVRMWKECGLPVSSAADSQALLQLKRQYCERRDCLHCRIGYEFFRKKN